MTIKTPGITRLFYWNYPAGNNNFSAKDAAAASQKGLAAVITTLAGFVGTDAGKTPEQVGPGSDNNQVNKDFLHGVKIR